LAGKSNINREREKKEIKLRERRLRNVPTSGYYLYPPPTFIFPFPTAPTLLPSLSLSSYATQTRSTLKTVCLHSPSNLFSHLKLVGDAKRCHLMMNIIINSFETKFRNYVMTTTFQLCELKENDEK